MQKGCFQIVLFIFGGLLAFHPSYAQDAHAVAISQDHFPFAFSNFVWWSDSDLRADLKKHIPMLREKIGIGSPMESQIRTVLTRLLREKGIQAEVQVMEPSRDVLSEKRAPEAPPQSITYSVLSPPEILVEKLVLQNAPDDASGPLSEVATHMVGKAYSEMTFWSDKQKIKDGLQQLGYLSSTVELDHGTPQKNVTTI